MKNLILFFSAISITLLSSCIKEKSGNAQTYTCECFGGFTGSYYSSETIYAKSRDEANATCTENNPPPNTPDAISCSLKD